MTCTLSYSFLYSQIQYLSLVCVIIKKQNYSYLGKGSFRRKKPGKKWDGVFVEALFPNEYGFRYMFSHFGRYLFVQYNITKELANVL